MLLYLQYTTKLPKQSHFYVSFSLQIFSVLSAISLQFSIKKFGLSASFYTTVFVSLFACLYVKLLNEHSSLLSIILCFGIVGFLQSSFRICSSAVVTRLTGKDNPAGGVLFSLRNISFELNHSKSIGIQNNLRNLSIDYN